MRAALRACYCIASYKSRRAKAMQKLSFNSNSNSNSKPRQAKPSKGKARQQGNSIDAWLPTQPPAQAKPFPPLKKGG
jgi:hypothetical protein